jgi:uncharacterized membrane protein (UPF0127 family)
MIFQVRKLGEERILVHRVVAARTPWARIKGLIGRKYLPPGEGIWLVPCNSIHMFGMRISIDVIFLDKTQKVLKYVSQVPPGKILWPVRHARSVLELGAGSLELVGELEGKNLVFEAVSGIVNC